MNLPISYDSNSTGRHVDRVSEWKSKLAIWSIGTMVFLSLSGLIIWWFPFSRWNQVNVLFHTLIGLLFLVPFIWYGIRHWLLYRGHVLTQIKLLGYLTIFILIASGVSGFMLTYESVFKRINYFWRTVHDWTTIVSWPS
ncbi:MAG: hypothetical protein U0V70_15465 [Terriglobia bacterium]